MASQYTHRTDQSLCNPLMRNVTLKATTISINVMGPPQPRNHFPTFHIRNQSSASMLSSWHSARSSIENVPCTQAVEYLYKLEIDIDNVTVLCFAKTMYRYLLMYLSIISRHIVDIYPGLVIIFFNPDRLSIIIFIIQTDNNVYLIVLITECFWQGRV